MRKNKSKKCRHCGGEFNPFNSTQIVCSPVCAIDYAKKKGTQKEHREWSQRKKVLKKKLETPSQKKGKLQETFNLFIRLRDRGKPCISCGKPLGNKYHAGHLYSVGGFPELRFNEWNVNGQCEWCNIHLHGNGNLYRIGLIQRIGEEKIKKLDSLAGIERHYLSHEIEDLEKKYKFLIKKIR